MNRVSVVPYSSKMKKLVYIGEWEGIETKDCGSSSESNEKSDVPRERAMQSWVQIMKDLENHTKSLMCDIVRGHKEMVVSISR